MALDTTAQLKAALLGLRKLKARVAELEAGVRAPIAVIGTGCRFPGGVHDAASWWSLLRDGVDAISEVPADHWDAKGLPDDVQAGGITSSQGGFLGDVYGFDAAHFRIAPREARAMDPQQRLLLEVAWEALEDAGTIQGAEGSNTGVFLGVALTDWEQRTLRHPEPGAMDVYAGTGSFNSVAAGRISYALGLRGPSVSLDTACSSSLVALHLACQSLRSGECDQALAGGVNLILSPDATRYFSKMGALAPDGRCKAFDASADGYVRAEGVGVAVLKRLDDALRDGDRVLAVVRGSAVNQDGRSNGLTAPSGPAQQAVVRAALDAAGVTPDEVGYIEAHGTGTPLGDPIEVDALRAVFGDGDHPLVLGAVKTQIGHAEAAAGIAGFLKVVEALRHRTIPANLHFHELNPRIRLGGSRLTVPTGPTPWRDHLVAGVSGFGMSGTNAHVVVSAAPDVDVPTPARPWRVLPLSAGDADRLDDLRAAATRALSDVPWPHAAYTAATGRLHGSLRLAVVASSSSEALAALPGATPTEAGRPKLAVALGAAMSADQVAELRASEPAYADAVSRRCAEGDVPEADVLQASSDAAQVVAWLALLDLLAVWGVSARGLTGTGPGLWAAAVASGAVDLADAVRVLTSDDRPGSLQALAVAAPQVFLTAGGRRAQPDGVRAALGGKAGTDVPALQAEGLDLVLDLGAGVDGAVPWWGADGPRARAEALAALWSAGVEVAWKAFQPAGICDWPTTPWQHEVFFLEDPAAAARAAADPRIWQTTWRPVTLAPRPDVPWCVLGDSALAVGLAQALGASTSLDPLVPGTHVVDAQALDGASVPDARATARRVVDGGGVLHVLVPAGPEACLPEDAARWGLGRVIATERPEAWGGLLAVGNQQAEAVADALLRADGRDLSLLDGTLREAVLLPARLPHAAWAPSGQGTWWLTGGTGALGRAMAAWLVARGVRHLVLSSRSGTDHADLDALRAQGAVVEVVQADVTDEASVARVRARLPGLRGVLHLAGVVDDAPLSALDDAGLAAVLAPKLRGTALLDAATRDAELEAFVVVTSASVALGIRGQAAYAAANAAAAAVVSARVAEGFAGTALSLGPVAGGMADAVVRRRLEAVGIGTLTPEEACSLMARQIAAGSPRLSFLRLDAARHAATTASPRLSAFLDVHVLAAPAPAAPAWSGLDAHARATAVRRAVAEVLAAVLGREDADALDPRAGYFDLGLDSMTAVAFAKDLEQRLDLPVPPTVAFDHGSIDDTTAWALATLAPVQDGPAAPAGPLDGPVAIVGMGCRFPGGVADPEAYWALLTSGVDAIGPIPPSRWDAEAWYDPTPGVPGRMVVREGGFVDGVEDFDADAFAMAPKEALALDPQQRLLLEVGVESLEHANLPLDRLRHTRTGVYVGIGPSDYGRRFDPLHGQVDPYAGTGNEPSFAAGRLAYALGVQGPAIGMNTACSTSLVTTHLACQALRAGECDLALAGGVNLMLSPETTVQLSQLSALSPTARCHTFDAEADGYARGEGCGMLVLKRLADAERDGDRVLAILRGSAVNHDGPSAGLTVPSGEAQQKLMRQALAVAGVAPAEVGFLEAHGTGTKLGDPIEMGAIQAVYGARPGDAPLVVSSVKTHIGHTELAAGAAGLIGAVLALQHQQFAPHLHLKTPNPAMDLDFPVRIPTALAPWTASAPRLAAVSSFGLSGTNAHVVLEEGPAEEAPTASALPCHPLTLSAPSEPALRSLASRLADALARGAELPDVAYTLAAGRASRAVRMGLVAQDAAQAQARLRAVAAGDVPVSTVRGRPPVVWLFTGQGAQFPGMARALYDAFDAFRDVIDRCEAHLAETRAIPLRDVLFGDDARIHDTAWAQPALYAVEMGLAALWTAWGVVPDAVGGHSLGEFAAATVAGVWTLEEGLDLVALRGSLMSALPQDGAMAQVALPEAVVRARLAGLDELDVAAVNAHDQTVVSGDRVALDGLCAALEAEGVVVRRLTVSHAFHSPKMTPMLGAFEARVAQVALQVPAIPVLSNVTARPEREALTEPAYWRRHVRGTVRFADGLQAAPAGAVFLELGSHPVLSALGMGLRPDAVFVPGLKRGDDDVTRMAAALAQAWSVGVPVSAAAWWQGEERRRVALPTTPWNRRRCWVEPQLVASASEVPGAALLFTTTWQDHVPQVRRTGPWHVVGPGADEVVAALRRAGDEATEGAGEGGVVVDLRSRAVAAPATAPLEALLQDVQAGRVVVSVVDDGPMGAAVVGLARGVGQELPSQAGGAVVWTGGDADALAKALRDGAPELAVRGDGVQAPVLVRATSNPVDAVSGTWWITGGLGAVGLALAEELVDLGAGRLVLTGRSAPSDEVQARVDGLGVPTEVLRGDVSDADDVARMVAHIGDDLAGVVHAAGVLADGLLRDMDSEALRTPWAAKAQGAWHLHGATQHLPLQGFVLLSSAAGTLGWTGQANYGAANAFLDGLARWRQGQGLVATSLAFGPWAGGGMADPQVQAAMASVGMRALSVTEARGALRRALGTSGADWLVVDLDWDAWVARHPAARARVAGLVQDEAPAPSAWAGLEGSARQQRLLATVRQVVAASLGHEDADSLDATRGLFDMGLDSLTAVQLARSLQQRVGLDVPDTAAFDHPSIDALVGWLEGRLDAAAPSVTAAARASSAEPVAIVGMAVRFPGGAEDVDRFWQLLADGRDAVVRVPSDRWDAQAFYDPTPGTPGRTYVREGGFVGDVAGFEPAVFGISPKEASRMDPQQRWLLACAWQALESAGIAPDGLADARCGVFVGIGGHDYERVLERSGVFEEDDAYAGTGNDPAFAAGRISYVLGTRGPALSLNTACSSSLVTTHLGVRSLRDGESDLVLAGGVRLMLSPGETLRLSAMRVLSPTARCHTFDAEADGYVRGEGCGMLVLERLSDARRHGHPVLAVIAGSAMNHDGPSSGLTVPSGPAQQALLREALEDAGLVGADVDVLEAHGTGTPLGDPIEVAAVGAVLGDRPADRPLLMGSVKTNLGHLELAAGVAGLVKTVLALQHDAVPAHQHFTTWNPRIAHDFPVVVPQQLTPWPRSHRRVAGVSAFGLSGTNAHVLVADAPDEAPGSEASPRTQHVLPLSAMTPEGLEAATKRLADHLAAHPGLDLADVAHTLQRGRAHLPHRCAVVAADVPGAIGQLGTPGLLGRVRRGTTPPGVALLFTGQGSQYAGMAQGLYASSPVFRDVIDRCDAHLRALRGEGLKAVLWPRVGRSAIDDTAWTQPALYAVEVGLAAVWLAAGVRPQLVLGHSIGELAAAHVAGLWSLEDGLTVVEARGRLMQALPRGGAMAALFADEATVAARLASLGGDVGIAALNGPAETVISGSEHAVMAVVASFEADDVAVRRLTVSHPFHSAWMEPMLEDFRAVVAGVARRTPVIPVLSNLTAAPERETLEDPDYWVRHVRDAVRFAPAIRRAVDEGVRWFIEVGPHPVLSGLGARAIDDPEVTWVSCLRRGQDDDAMLGQALARVHVGAQTLDWGALQDGTRRQHVVLPGTVFQTTRHWVDGGQATVPRTAGAPTLAWRWQRSPKLEVAPGQRVWVLGDAGLAASLTDAWTADGHTVARIGDGTPAEVAASLREHLRDGTPDRVVWLAGLAAGPGVEAAEADLDASVGRLLSLVQRLGEVAPAPLTVLTQQADTTPSQAAVAALFRVVALEQPALFGGWVDLQADADPAQIARAALASREDALRVAGRSIFGGRLVHADPAPAQPLTGGAVLITGGLGALGRQVARRCLEDGAPLVVLTSRHAPPVEVLEALPTDVGRVEIVLGDVSDAADAARVVAEASGFGHRLGAIVHAAGVLDDGALATLTWDRVVGLLGAKVHGARHLAEAAHDLDALVLFSSATAWLGAHGQANYAAVNGWLDGYAGWLRSQGVPAVSVGFGPWQGAGMVGDAAEAMQRRGILPLVPQAALASLASVWRGAQPAVAIADARWSTYRPVYEARGPRASLDGLAPPGAAPTAAPAARADVTRKADVHDAVAQAVAHTLGFGDAGALDPGQGFFDMGLDSITAVTLSESLSSSLGVPLSSAAAFDHPTIDRLTRHLLDVLGISEAPAVPQPPVAAVTVDDPIAVVGMACRFPGAPDVAAFWQLLVDGVCAVGQAPSARWPGFDALYDPTPGTPGRTYTQAGGFLDDIAGFDPKFFGISPREAKAMDPQQRLLLEVAYEALEDAALSRAALADTQTGVWVGMGASEYDARFARNLGTMEDAYAGTGNDTSFAAGRISYLLGLHGPAMTVNTACSAALVSLHLAVQALRLGECDLALAGAVNLMVAPESHVRLAALRALSPTGLCRAFDAEADGYVRGEGAGVLVLERLSEAQAKGHRVLAIVKGSAVNHDGPSSALTVPSGPAQTALLRRAWAQAGITGDELGYVEAHGTGTRLGDPIEARALAAALGERTRTLPVGSAKTNVGHLELAAGAVGLIKTILALQHGVVPPHLHLTRRNPDIPDDLPLSFPTVATPWKGPRVAGVSSFGLSGTNAHVVLEAAPLPEARVAQTNRVHVVPLAGHTEAVRDALAEAVGRRLTEVPLADVAFTAAMGRTDGPIRMAVVGDDPTAVQRGLRGAARAGRFVGEAPVSRPKVALLCSGQGAVTTAGELMATSSVFREAIDELDSVVTPAWGTSVVDVLQAGDGIERLEFAGPALFAFEVAMARLWQSWGVEPDALLGHGIGEIVAAHLAGVWSLEDAARFVVARAEAITHTPPGQMVALKAPEALVRRALAGRDDVAVAAVNGPDATVIAGTDAGVAAVVAGLPGVVAMPLGADRAYHSPLMDPAAEAIRAAASSTTMHRPRVPLIVGRLGRFDPDGVASAQAWVDHAREAVRFGEGMETLVDHGVSVFLEVGPHPVLVGMARRAVDPRGRAFLASHRRDRGFATLAESAAQAWVRGVPLDWAAFARDAGGRRVSLPSTPYARVRCWVDDGAPDVPVSVAPAPSTAQASRPDVGAWMASAVAKLLGVAVDELDTGRPLAWQGFDSIMAAELKRQIDATFGVQVPDHEVLAGPSVAELVGIVRAL